MAQFATNADLAARLGVTFTPGEQSRADQLLTITSGLVQREARQTIELVTNEILTVPGRADTRFRLPERPVVSISSVTLNGTTVAAGEDNWLDYHISGDFIIRRAGWGEPDQPLVITYTHGFDPNKLHPDAEVLEAIKAVCLEAVVRAWVNPGNVLRESYGSDMTQYAGMTVTPTGLLLTTEEQRVVHDVLRRPAGSIALR